MLEKLGVAGVAGIVVLFAGIGLVAWQNLILAAGLALVVSGLALLVYGLVTSLLSSLGLGGMP